MNYDPDDHHDDDNNDEEDGDDAKNTTTKVKVNSSPPSPHLDKQQQEMVRLPRKVRIISWNLCHFTSFRSNLTQVQHKGSPLSEEASGTFWTYTQLVMKSLQSPEAVDIFVLQELPKADRQSRIDSFLSCLDDREAYRYAEDSDSEHLFVWNTKTVRTKRYMDKLHTLVKDGVKRPMCTMQFIVGEAGGKENTSSNGHEDGGDSLRLILSSIHLKSGGGDETVNNLRALVSQYPEKAAHRYGFTEPNTLHVVAGDFNLNLHDYRKEWESDWTTTGNEFTRTSAGGKGYDFFMIYLKSTAKGKVGFYQKEYVQPLIKNPSKGELGISDHDPIILTIYPYQRVPS